MKANDIVQKRIDSMFWWVRLSYADKIRIIDKYKNYLEEGVLPGTIRGLEIDLLFDLVNRNDT